MDCGREANRWKSFSPEYSWEQMKKMRIPNTWLGFLPYFLRLGMFGYGVPIALAGYMQHDLVEKRGWVTPEEYRV